VVLDRDDIAGFKSLRNIPSVHVLDAGQLNTYDVLVNDDVVFSRGGLDAFLARTGHKELPDLSTDDIPGEPIPSEVLNVGTVDTASSVAPAAGEGTVTESSAVSDGGEDDE
jgi:large subunit ribosomal protein L4